jgi:hypothetical protein
VEVAKFREKLGLSVSSRLTTNFDMQRFDVSKLEESQETIPSQNLKHIFNFGNLG